MQTPTRYVTVLNLRTAKALGLDVPAAVLALADEVLNEAARPLDVLLHFSPHLGRTAPSFLEERNHLVELGVARQLELRLPAWRRADSVHRVQAAQGPAIPSSASAAAAWHSAAPAQHRGSSSTLEMMAPADSFAVVALGD